MIVMDPNRPTNRPLDFDFRTSDLFLSMTFVIVITLITKLISTLFILLNLTFISFILILFRLFVYIFLISRNFCYFFPLYLVTFFCRKFFVYIFRYLIGNHIVSMFLNVHYKVSFLVYRVALLFVNTIDSSSITCHPLINYYVCHVRCLGIFLYSLGSCIDFLNSRLTIYILYTSAGVFHFIYSSTYLVYIKLCISNKNLMRMDKLFHYSCVRCFTYLSYRCLINYLLYDG